MRPSQIVLSTGSASVKRLGDNEFSKLANVITHCQALCAETNNGTSGTCLNVDFCWTWRLPQIGGAQVRSLFSENDEIHLLSESSPIRIIFGMRHEGMIPSIS